MLRCLDSNRKDLDGVTQLMMAVIFVGRAQQELDS